MRLMCFCIIFRVICPKFPADAHYSKRTLPLSVQVVTRNHIIPANSISHYAHKRNSELTFFGENAQRIF